MPADAEVTIEPQGQPAGMLVLAEAAKRSPRCLWKVTALKLVAGGPRLPLPNHSSTPHGYAIKASLSVALGAVGSFWAAIIASLRVGTGRPLRAMAEARSFDAVRAFVVRCRTPQQRA